MAQNKSTDGARGVIAWIGLGIIWGIYSYLTFQTPSQQATTRYNLDVVQLNLLKLTVIIPVLIIWSAILYSCLKLHSYSQIIIHSEDGRAFRLIAQGVFFMLVSSISSSYISLFIQFSQNNPGLVVNLRILNNYVVVFLALSSFYLIWKGSRKLITIANAEKKIKKQAKFIWFSVFMLSFPYVYFVLQNPVRNVSDMAGINSTYNLPDVLILATIVAPYILTWLLGIYSVVNMSIFKEETKGIIYKNVLGKFYRGFLTVIVLVISMQYLTQFSTFLSQANLSIILIIVYIILFVNALGLMMVANGARQLTKIETA